MINTDFFNFKYLFYLQLLNTQGIHSKLEGQKAQLSKMKQEFPQGILCQVSKQLYLIHIMFIVSIEFSPLGLIDLNF